MAHARDIMKPGAECIGEGETLVAAARRMRDLHVGARPICGNDDRLQGIITDRDIVVHCVAENRGLLPFLWVAVHDRPGSGGQRPPRLRVAMAISASAEW
jgi:CBS-domain-containing membrane protein